MKKIFYTILIMILPAASMAVQVIAYVDKSSPIYASEPFAYQIIIDGESKAGKPDLGPLNDFNPRFDGQQDVIIRVPADLLVRDDLLEIGTFGVPEAFSDEIFGDSRIVEMG